MGTDAVQVDQSNFDQIIKANPLVMVDFSASWCGPCKALAPTIEALASEYKDRMVIGKLDVDESPDLAERFQVFSVPTVLIMKNQQEVARIIGCVPKERFETAIKKHLE